MSQTISLNDAKTMTYAWQESEFGSNNKFAAKIDVNDVQTIMDEEGCRAIRIYFGLDDNEDMTVVLVGVDANNNDLTSGPLVDMALMCPTNCPTNSALIK